VLSSDGTRFRRLHVCGLRLRGKAELAERVIPLGGGENDDALVAASERLLLAILLLCWNHDRGRHLLGGCWLGKFRKSLNLVVEGRPLPLLGVVPSDGIA
jgi:hypothetical protein